MTKERVVIELETDIKRTTLGGKQFSYISGGSPDDLKTYSSEKAKELLIISFVDGGIVLVFGLMTAGLLHDDLLFVVCNFTRLYAGLLTLNAVNPYD